MKLHGTITALITPFADGNVDVEGLKRNIAFQIDSEVQGILLLGTTGEAPTLSPYERELVIRTGVAAAKGKVGVWVGTGSYSTEETKTRTRQAGELGADVALVVTPYYNKPTQEGIYCHFEAVAKSSEVPLVVYNIEGRCSRNIETKTLMRLARLKNIVGVKEASGSMQQMAEVLHELQAIRPDFAVFSGDDSLTLPLMALGGVGVVSVVSNLVPGEMVALAHALLQGEMEKARQLHRALFPLFKAAFLEVNPVPIKEAMTLLGMAAGTPRLPLVEMEPQNKAHLRETLFQLGLL